MNRGPFLLDTHILIWLLTDSPALSPTHREILRAEKGLVVSHVSFWEIAIKRALGKLHMPDGYIDTVLASNASILPVTIEHIRNLETLPHHHRDPFDRMLIAQAKCEGLTLITADPAFGAYDIATL